MVKGWDSWYSWVTEVLERDYGDTSFSSFVKMVLAQGKEVKIGELENGRIRWVLKLDWTCHHSSYSRGSIFFYEFLLEFFFDDFLFKYFYNSFNICLYNWVIQMFRYVFRCRDIGSSLPSWRLMKCHMWPVRCHMWPVMCHMSCVKWPPVWPVWPHPGLSPPWPESLHYWQALEALHQQVKQISL